MSGDVSLPARGAATARAPERPRSQATARDARGGPQRARFDAVRRYVFEEMDLRAKRWRHVWFLPFNVVLFGALLARGESHTRAALQLGSVALVLLASTAPAGTWIRRRPWAYVVHQVHFGVITLTTGTIASPLLPMAMPMMAIAALLLDRRRDKRLFTLGLGATFVLLAVVSRTSWGGLPTPLAPHGGHTSVEFVVVAAVTLVFTATSLLKIGIHVTDAYAQVALELAARREEIFTESEDHTRTIEGVAARLAHEVKNPLAAIKGLSAHMAQSATDTRSAERLAIVAKEADRLQSIVDGFLGFSRGLDDLKVAPTKPYEIGRELVLLLETRAAEAGVSVEVVGDESVEVQADGRKLRQAMLNLVLNAMQASGPEGKVTIAVARAKPCAHAEATASPDDPRPVGVRIKVIDHGAGMTSQVLERIRRPYFTTREGGSGLGIAVARAVVEQHGGRLLFESEAGRGTTATIELCLGGPPEAGAPLPGLSLRPCPDGTKSGRA